MEASADSPIALFDYHRLEVTIYVLFGLLLICFQNKFALTWKQGLLFHKVTSWTMIIFARYIPLTQGSLEAGSIGAMSCWFKLIWYWNTHMFALNSALSCAWLCKHKDVGRICFGTSKILATMLVPCTMCLFQHVYPFCLVSVFLPFFLFVFL